MILKENIKAKVDKLNNYELRVVELLIDSLKRKSTKPIKKTGPSKNYPWQEVIELMGQHTVNSKDINQGREERL